NRAKREAANKEAQRRLAEENKERAEKGQPKRIIPGREWRDYVRRELGLDYPSTAPRLGKRDYSTDEVLEHLEAVYEMLYEPKDLKEPSINFVVLVNEDANSDPSEDRLKRIAKEFRGSVGIFRGSKNPQELMKQLGEEVQE
ncbi:MAG TPA: hypothetical protein VJ904_02410, partial [Tichowtungia sp.]|nr:hypothetical protein [Tichowtungia sp.]